MSSFFGDQKLTLTCGQCGHKSEETVRRLETSPKIACPKCGVVTEYDASDFKAKLADVDKSIEKLKKSFGKLGKR